MGNFDVGKFVQKLNGVDLATAKKIISKDIRVLLRLSRFNNRLFNYGLKLVADIESVEESLRLLNVLEVLSKNDWLVKFLNNPINAGKIAVNDLELFCCCSHNFNASYAYVAYTNSFLREKGLVKEAIKIIGNSSSADKAEMASNLLCSKSLIDEGVSLEMANILNHIYVSDATAAMINIAFDENIKDKELKIKSANVMVKDKGFLTTWDAFKVLTDPLAIEAGISVEGGLLIIEMRDMFLAKRTVDILTNPTAIQNQTALPIATLLANNVDSEKLEEIFAILKESEYSQEAYERVALMILQENNKSRRRVKKSNNEKKH